MNKIIFCIIILGVIYTYKRNSSTAAPRSSSSAESKFSNDKVLVIEFNDENDLLLKLRSVKTAQQIDMRYIGGKRVVTGIACSDKEALAKFHAQESARVAPIIKDINLELQRILVVK